MKCPACGSDNPDSALYCGMCKEVFRRDQPPPPKAPPKATAPKAPAPVALRPLQNGDLVGSYTIIKKLGEGGFGIVYLAYLAEADHYVALKTFRDQLISDPEARQNFRSEAQTWVDLEKHPFIVRAHLVEEFHHRLFIAMEYVPPGADGNSLESVLVRRQPAAEEALRWMIQICRAMEHAQARGIAAHRDLKPANVLLDRGTAKLADFGLAQVIGRESGSGGTPAYMPAEQWKGKGDLRSDVYAAGVMFYQLLSRRLPFMPPQTNDAMARLYQMHAMAPPPPLETPAWPILARCLAKAPEKRYQSFVALRADLEKLLGNEVAPPTREELTLDVFDLGHKGLSLAALERFDEAMVYFDRALRLDPLEESTWHNKGNLLQLMERHAEAIELFDGALNLIPDHPRALRGKARSLFELGRTGEAITCMEKGLALDGGTASAWNNYGLLLGRLGRKDDELKSYQRALELDPRFVLSWINYANALAAQGRFAEAAAACTRTSELEAPDSRTFSNLAHCLLNAGKPQAALPAIERALAMDPSFTIAHYNRGQILVRLGRDDDAHAAFERALALDANYSAPWYRLGEMELRLGRVGQAGLCFDRVIDLDPDPKVQKAAREKLAECEAIVHSDLALDLAKAGKYEEALQKWKRALEYSPNYARAWYDSGVTLGRLGRLEEALGCFTRILNDPRFGKEAAEISQKIRAKIGR